MLWSGGRRAEGGGELNSNLSGLEECRRDSPTKTKKYTPGAKIMDEKVRRVTQGQWENDIQIKVLGSNMMNYAGKRCPAKSNPRTRSNNQEKEDLKIEELKNRLGDLKRQIIEKNKKHLQLERQLREQIIFEQDALSREIKCKENLKMKHSKLQKSNKIKENQILKDFGEARRHISALYGEVKNLRSRNSELQDGYRNEGKSDKNDDY